MMKRFTLLAALAMTASFAADARAQSVRFSGYSQLGPGSITYTQTSLGAGGPLPVTLSGNASVAFTINRPEFLINPAGPQLYEAQLTLNAQSSTAVVAAPGENRQEGFSGTFSIVSGGVNLLSGTFTNAVLSQNRPETLAFSTATTTFTSDIFIGLVQPSFILGFSGGFGTLGISSGAFDPFTATGTSGDFNAIPEPATLAMAGLGVLALPLALRVARRRRADGSN